MIESKGKPESKILRPVLLVLFFTAAAVGATQSGVVRSGGRGIPGAVVTAICGTDKISTVTDGSGNFEVGGLPDAPCEFSVGMFGFEAAKKQSAASATPLNFDLTLQAHATVAVDPTVQTAPAGAAAAGPGRGSRGQGRGGFGQGGQGRGGVPGDGSARARNGTPSPANPGRAGAGRGGFQNLSLVQNPDTPVESSEIAPGAGGAPEDATGSNEAFLVSGSLSQGVQAQPGDANGLGGPGGPGGFGAGGPGAAGNPFGGAGGQNIADTGLPTLGGGGGAPGGGGGFGGGGGGGGRGGAGGGGGRGGGRGGPPPNRNVQFGNRINRGRGQQFQGSAYYTVGNSVLNARPYSFTSPTQLNGAEVPKAAYAANRFGFSAGGPFSIPHLFSSDKTFWFVNYTGNRSKNGYDKVSTVPTPDQRNSVTNINPISAALLYYIPLPNAPGTRNNFQLIGANPTNNDNIQARINQTISAKDRLDVNVNFQHRDSQTIQNFGFIDPTNGYGLSSSLTYGRTFSRSLINRLVWSFSRNLSQTLSPFSYGSNIEGTLGINGVTLDPAAFGPPTLNFANFTSLSDATPSLSRAQSSGVNDNLIFIHGKQTLTLGAGFQRRQTNTLTDANGRGTFTFTGVVTGSDLSDFLLGLPQQTSVTRYTDNSRYLRQSTINAFATDDFRVRSNLTINAGIRWEYFAPVTEKYNHIANLDVSPAFNAVAPVLPGQTGPYSGLYSAGLVNSDPLLFSPRIGIAWKPWKEKQTVIRAGYGMYYNGGVYNQIASRLLNQPPFAQPVIVQTSLANPLTFQNGFGLPTGDVSNTFAVDKSYKPGYAQTWTGSIQQTFARSYVVELIYNGTKGTNLDVLQLPNRALPGNPLTAQQRLLIPNVSEFTYDSAIGTSIYNSGQIRFTRRFNRSASFNLFYTYSKAIDDSSTLGGGPVFIPNDLSAERALSPTDQRHNVRLNYTIQSPVKTTQTGRLATLGRGWTLGGTLTASSGTPFTAIVVGDNTGTAYTGNARAQATGQPVTNGSGYFNLAAFAVPATGIFGNAGRDTIPGIASFSLNASLFRSFRIDDKRRMEFRIDSTNPLNHVNVTSINTTVDSQQYGLPVAAGAMRNITATVRLRF